jgi:hypothetical protein
MDRWWSIVLDFGLAKAFDAAGSPDADVSAVTLTAAFGAIVGTPIPDPDP